MTNLTLQDLDPSPWSSTTTTASGKEQLTFLDPTPSYEESIAAPRPNALQILGATFGGVVVTPDIQKLVGDSDRLSLDLRTLNVTLRPDPAPGQLKVLTILYRFDDDDPAQGNDARLMVVAEDAGPASRVIRIDRHMTGQQQARERAGLRAGGERYFHGVLERPWRAGAGGEVDILAVVFGPKRVEEPAVLSVLSNHFEGRWGQVRMTNGFFGKDPWPYKRKSWTVYFRFVGSQKVQVVTGWENGALEVPWSRHA